MPQDDRLSESRRDTRKRMELELVRFTMGLATGLLCAYILYFGVLKNLGAGGPTSWAEFGDFFGGVVNPIVGIVTVILVVETLRTTRDEAEQTRIHLEMQTEQMRLQVLHFERQQELAEIQKRLDGTLAAWNEVMAQPIAKVVRRHPEHGYRRVQHEGTLGSLLYEPGYHSEISEICEGGWAQEISAFWMPKLEIVLHMLDEFARYCAEYDAISGNRKLTDYYRHRIQLPLRVVMAANLISENEAKPLLVGLKFRV
jgi:hypothetical protein